MTLKNRDVADVFDQFPSKTKSALLELRKRILDVAARTDGVGEIEETLKWGEPSYVTTKTKSGSTIRISSVRNQPEKYAMYLNCNTNLLERYRQAYSSEFIYEGKRAVIFKLDAKLPGAPLDHIIAMALTYHLQKRKR